MQKLMQIIILTLIPVITIDVRAQSDSDTLLAAIKSDNVEIVESEINAENIQSYAFAGVGTALQVAVKNRAYKVASSLLEAGADVNATTESNKLTPLILAVKNKKSALYKDIIELGANLDAVDANSETALIHAIRSNNIEAISTLISEKANLEIKNRRDLTPMMVAFLSAKTNVLELLLDNGAMLDAEALANTIKCGRCHSVTGPGISGFENVPHLAGQHAPYIVKQLRDYQAKERVNAKMIPPSKALTEDIIVALADYYSKLVRVKGVSNATSEEHNLGEGIYMSICAVCHGSDGVATINMLTPSLAGLNAQYIVDQLFYFKEGKRTNDPDGVMREAVKSMSEEEIIAVAEYVQNLP